MKTTTFIFLLFSCLNALGQQSGRDYDRYKALRLGVGYSYVGAQDGEQAYHFIDLGVNRARYGGRHGGGFQYGIGTEIGINTHGFMVGPKAEGMVYFQFLAIGAALVTYTDFEAFSPRLVPVLGLGNEKVRLTFNPHIVLANKDLLPVPGFVNLAVNFTLDRKKYDK
ncbi:hypothetical protein [Flavobacterium sp.]|uniref:hypothetical protein n=1 Tax=Flavobacterium sp. TaxID=239 RepID=UPI0026287EC7|nr:hypothetical protein [Flavobacterium sp.]